MKYPATIALLVLAAAPLASCAWTNRANRPVWNWYEQNVVPEGDTAFWVALPLTFPGGVLAILTDALIVHPAQVADDAVHDAGDLWRSIDWKEDYYTQLAALPVRVAGTPVVFTVSFLARSMFDIPPLQSDDEAESIAVQRTMQWLGGIAAGGHERLGSIPRSPQWTDTLQHEFAAALESATAAGRLSLYRDARKHHLPPHTSDPTRGLRDPDPVVRYLELLRWRNLDAVPDELRAALLEDPNEIVRALARERME